jgi:prohibitin 2
MEQQFPIRRVIAIAIAVLVIITLIKGTYVVPPGHRGVKVTLGTVDKQYVHEGMGFKMPWVTSLELVSVKQQNREILGDCYSQDLQQVKVRVKVLYAIPEASVVTVFREYQGDAFDSLVAPRVQEALKEQTALLSAEQVVKQREVVKRKSRESAQAKIGQIVQITDLTLENIDLSSQLEQAIEMKMVQEQNANKAKFEQEKRKIDAETKLIEARAEAESIKIRGEALKATPDLIQLQIVEKWDGRAPMVIGGDVKDATGIILPLPERK